MNDLQIVSGLAILISGYYAITTGALIYHWKMIIQIAWFSTITHLGGLSCLRSHLYQNKIKRSLRLIFSLSLAIMLIVALISTAPSSPYFDTRPAVCLFEDPDLFRDLSSGWDTKNAHKNASNHDPNRNAADASFTILMLIYNVTLRIIKLHRKALRTGSLWVRKKLTHVVKETLVESAPVRFIINPKRLPRLQMFLYIMFVQRFIAAFILFDVYWLMATSAVGEVRNNLPMCRSLDTLRSKANHRSTDLLAVGYCILRYLQTVPDEKTRVCR